VGAVGGEGPTPALLNQRQDEENGPTLSAEKGRGCIVAILRVLTVVVLWVCQFGDTKYEVQGRDSWERQRKRAQDRIDAYSNMSVVLALVFGFAVSSFTGGSNAIQLTNTQSDDNAKAAAGFAIVMCLVILSTACSLMAFTGHNFVLGKLQVAAPSHLGAFMKASRFPNYLALFCAVTAVPLYLLGLTLYAIAILDRQDLRITLTVILFFGIFFSVAGPVALLVLFKYFQYEENHPFC